MPFCRSSVLSAVPRRVLMWFPANQVILPSAELVLWKLVLLRVTILSAACQIILPLPLFSNVTILWSLLSPVVALWLVRILLQACHIMSYGLLAAFLNSITLFVRILPLYIVLCGGPSCLYPAFQALVPAVAFVCSNTTFFPLVPFVMISPPLVIHIIVPAPFGAVELLVNNTSLSPPKFTLIESSAPQYVIPADPSCVNLKSFNAPFTTRMARASQRIEPFDALEELQSTFFRGLAVVPALIALPARQYISPLPVVDHSAVRLFVLIS